MNCFGGNPPPELQILSFSRENAQVLYIIFREKGEKERKNGSLSLKIISSHKQNSYPFIRKPKSLDDCVTLVLAIIIWAALYTCNNVLFNFHVRCTLLDHQQGWSALELPPYWQVTKARGSKLQLHLYIENVASWGTSWTSKVFLQVIFTMTVTSSWFFLRSPWGMFSSSWNSIRSRRTESL